MQEILINVDKDRKNIMLVENGKLIEKYEENDEKDKLEGNIYLGVVENVLPGMQAAFVDIGKEKNTFIHIRDIVPKVSNETGNKNEKFKDYNISDYLKSKMPVLVQVKKDSSNKKGARISAHLSIPGRFVVLLPDEKFVTLSQKIDDEEERNRLKQIAETNLPKEYGAIVRTSAIDKSDKEIAEDIKKTISKYTVIKKKYDTELKKGKNIKPKLLFKSEDATQRLITDLMDQDLQRIVTNDEKTYQEVQDKLKEENKEIKLEVQDNILGTYNLSKQLEDLENRRIWLKCGGFITIDKTEALTAIDVNSGKYTGKRI